jgi:putative transposase
MRKSTFTEEQIVYALKQVELGVAMLDVCRKYGVSEQTFYGWRKRYGGLEAGELRRLKQLGDENRKLKQLVAELSLDKHVLQEVSKKL